MLGAYNSSSGGSAGDADGIASAGTGELDVRYDLDTGAVMASQMQSLGSLYAHGGATSVHVCVPSTMVAVIEAAQREHRTLGERQLVGDAVEEGPVEECRVLRMTVAAIEEAEEKQYGVPKEASHAGEGAMEQGVAFCELEAERDQLDPSSCSSIWRLLMGPTDASSSQVASSRMALAAKYAWGYSAFRIFRRHRNNAARTTNQFQEAMRNSRYKGAKLWKARESRSRFPLLAELMSRLASNRYTILSSDADDPPDDDQLPPSDESEHSSDDSGSDTPIMRPLPTLTSLLAPNANTSPILIDSSPPPVRRICRGHRSSSVPPQDSPLDVDIRAEHPTSDDILFTPRTEKNLLRQRREAQRQASRRENRVQKVYRRSLGEGMRSQEGGARG
ncbi:hypothetical protein B0H14DRAFT_2650164 [Mycena olivaceomarginata]|nr:hypothetical protein B0H14DRAFT_2650164 [Mycena olivaceomarginata]